MNVSESISLFALARSHEQVLEFLNTVDLATRFYICFFQCNRKGRTKLNINWAGPKKHLIAGIGGESGGELGEFMVAQG